ncbi:MAG: ribosome small subunit-dependent GTPase A [Planctomycetota bacterium]|jgi:ribosome biogenesis GTPase
MAKKKKKIRAEFRKNRGRRARQTDWTRQFEQHGFEDDCSAQTERVSGKGDLTRRRTITGTEADLGEEPGFNVELEVDPAVCRAGRVLRVDGLLSTVQGEDGTIYRCATRRLLKTLQTDQRHVVAAGDRVLFRPIAATDVPEGIIQRVEPRRGSLCRTSRGRQHILVTNVDQVLIVASAAEPRLKPNLIDRLLATAEKGGIRPAVCINKVDLVDPASLQPLAGVYSQMGYCVLLLSAKTGFAVDRLLRLLKDRESVVIGQSGVGKSSLLNAVDGSLKLRVEAVSLGTEKGRHTTSTAELLPLEFGGYVVDTPGIRQFQLWDVIPEEVAGLYRDLRPYVSYCRFPDCTHTHETDCAVKDAVADGRVDERRYASYCHLFSGDVD